MSTTTTTQAITQALQIAEKFIDQYYKSYPKTVGKFYKDQTKVIWQGNGYSGQQFKQDILPSLPLTHFDVHGYDAHPLGQQSGQYLINVSGTAKQNGRKSQFAQNFVLDKSTTMMYIQSDCFRLV